jgi:hypothetical protein
MDMVLVQEREIGGMGSTDYGDVDMDSLLDEIGDSMFDKC